MIVENADTQANSSDSTSPNELPALESKVVGEAVGTDMKFMYSIYDNLTSSDSDEDETEISKSASELADAIRPTLRNLDCSGFLYSPTVPEYSP